MEDRYKKMYNVFHFHVTNIFFEVVLLYLFICPTNLSLVGKDGFELFPITFVEKERKQPGRYEMIILMRGSISFKKNPKKPKSIRNKMRVLRTQSGHHCACVCVSVSACMRLSVCVYVSLCVPVLACTCMNAYVYVHAFSPLCVCLCVYVSVCTHVSAYEFIMI